MCLWVHTVYHIYSVSLAMKRTIEPHKIEQLTGMLNSRLGILGMCVRPCICMHCHWDLKWWLWWLMVVMVFHYMVSISCVTMHGAYEYGMFAERSTLFPSLSLTLEKRQKLARNCQRNECERENKQVHAETSARVIWRIAKWCSSTKKYVTKTATVCITKMDVIKIECLCLCKCMWRVHVHLHRQNHHHR